MTRPVVEIVTNERAGTVTYREEAHAHRFDWELGGGDVVAIIYVPSPADWDAVVPWAAGRRDEVLGTVAREVSRQKAPGCRVEIFERWIHLSEPPSLRARLASAWRRLASTWRENA